MERGNKELISMLSVTEEINGINNKVRQLVEDLHGTQGVLINLQELTAKLNEKVAGLKEDVGSYKPIVENTESNDTSQASYNNGGSHSRITFGEHMPDKVEALTNTPKEPAVNKNTGNLEMVEPKVANKVDSNRSIKGKSVPNRNMKKPPVKKVTKRANPLQRFQKKG